MDFSSHLCFTSCYLRTLSPRVFISFWKNWNKWNRPCMWNQQYLKYNVNTPASPSTWRLRNVIKCNLIWHFLPTVFFTGKPSLPSSVELHGELNQRCPSLLTPPFWRRAALSLSLSLLCADFTCGTSSVALFYPVLYCCAFHRSLGSLTQSSISWGSCFLVCVYLYHPQCRVQCN